MTPEREARSRAGLEEALRAGLDAMSRGGGTALDAVEAAIRVLENCPLFNAGRGSVLNHDGEFELDAGLMEGPGRRAGAVAGLRRIKNPIAAARAVLEHSGHVFLAGEGAERFAREQGLETAEPEYFRVQERLEALRRALRREADDPRGPASRMGTVGAVALDPHGQLAAGTSTGGTTAKRPGRVGDSPVIGAGLYVEPGVCAVSCTGDGEHFLRLAVAHEIVALVKYRGLTVEQAAGDVIHRALTEIGGEGGAIVLGVTGAAAMPFNSQGMYRGSITAAGEVRVAIYE